MKKMTIKDIKEYYYENSVSTKAMIYEFMDHPEDTSILKKYKRLTKYLFCLAILSSPCIIIIGTGITANFNYLPFTILFILFITLGIVGREITNLFKKAESLNGKTLDYSRSERLILYCKNVLQLDYNGIRDLTEECEKKGNIQATKLSFLAFLAVIIALASLFMAIILPIHKDEILKYIINIALTIIFSSIMWFLFKPIYTDHTNKESNTYRKIAELLKEVNYQKKNTIHINT
ncbi:hypothetical protein [Pedobacter sp. NJ-S-72]